jgi:hypothetical protein
MWFGVRVGTVRKYAKPRIIRNEGRLPMMKLGCIVAVGILESLENSRDV